MAVDAITDCVGCIIAGAGEPVAEKLAKILGGTPASDGARRVPLIGTGRLELLPIRWTVSGMI